MSFRYGPYLVLPHAVIAVNKMKTNGNNDTSFWDTTATEQIKRLHSSSSGGQEKNHLNYYHGEGQLELSLAEMGGRQIDFNS
jgi:hypothetical protein